MGNEEGEELEDWVPTPTIASVPASTNPASMSTAAEPASTSTAAEPALMSTAAERRHPAEEEWFHRLAKSCENANNSVGELARYTKEYG